MTAQRVELWELQWTFGDRFRKARRVAGITVAEMADLLGVSRSAVSQWETSITLPRSANAIAKRLQVAYGIPAWWLLGHQSDPTKPATDDGGRLRQLPDLDSNQEPSVIGSGAGLWAVAA